MRKQAKNSKIKKVWKIILAIFLLLLIVIFFGINGYVEGIIKSKVDTELNEKPGNLYHISYEDLNLNILSGSVSIINITIAPTDSTIQLFDNGMIRNIAHTQVDLFKIKHLKIFDFINDKNVDISRVIVKNTTTEFRINPDVETPKKKETGKKEKLFPNTLNRVSIGDFEFINSTFLLSDNQNKDEFLFEIDSLSIVVKDVFMDSSTVVNPIPLKFSDIQINTKYFGLTSMKYYSISTSGIGFNVQDTTLAINHFKLIPKYSRDEFNQMIQYNDDLFSISTEKVVLNGLSMSEIEKSESFSFNSVVVHQPEISIYRDKRLPDAPFKYKSLITSAVKKIPVSVIIDTIQILNGKLLYEEMHDLTDQPGKVFFDPLFLTAYNFTNDSVQIEKNPHLQIDLQGNIMGESEINANFDFYLNRNDDYFVANGKLEAISGTAFNPMVENMMLVKIESGDVHSAVFYFTATDNASKGTLDLSYENLKAEVLKHKDPEKKSGAISFFANELIKNTNLPGDKKYRQGNIYFERRKDKAIVNFLWNSVKTGIISTVAPIADKNRKAFKKEEKETIKQEKQAHRKSKKTNQKK